MQKVKLSFIILVCMSTKVFAGNLEPPAGPNDAASAMYSIEAIYQRLNDGTPGTRRTGVFREPTAPPGSTGHDLNEVMGVAPSNVVDAATTNDVRSGKPFWGLTTNEWGTLSGTMPDQGAVTYTPRTTDQAVAQGYHNGSGKVEGDADLVTTNIRVDVTLFGVTGANYACFLPKTGQTNSYLDGDDGWHSTNYGIAWPVPRFTIESNTNCVTDNMTGLMWARNADAWGNIQWTNAVTNCNSLVYGGYDDWRLPNRTELNSLIDIGKFDPALPDGHPFNNIGAGAYWSGTTRAEGTESAWYVIMKSNSGYVYHGPKTRYYHCWPVRGGP